jgi:hypothetical protein
MSMKIGTVAAQFPEKEYINGIFVAVHVKARLSLVLACMYTPSYGMFMAEASWC